MPECGICGRKIKFVKRAGEKALIVNPRAVFIVPDDSSRYEYVLTNGKMRRGRVVADGLKAFVLHQCQKEESRN